MKNKNQFVHRTGFTPYKLGFIDGLNARLKSNLLSNGNQSKDYLDGYQDGSWASYCQDKGLKI